MKRISLLIYICFCCLTNLLAQADISMSTSWYNRSNYNPASIAKLNYIYFFSNIREQWNGIAGGPQTINVQISGFNYENRSAFGLSLVNDRIGLVESYNPMLSYAYRISNDEEWSLSFGIAGGVFSRVLNTGSFNPENSADPILNQDFERLLKPDANIGIEFQSPHFIAGLSTTHLFSIADIDPYYLISNHRYGYFIFKSSDSELHNFYAGLQLINRRNIFVGEANVSIRFKDPTGLTTCSRELFEIGFTYRTTKQFTALFGVNLSPDFKIGYAYNQTFKPGYNKNGSHEIMLEYRIPVKTAQCPVCNVENSWYR